VAASAAEEASAVVAAAEEVAPVAASRSRVAFLAAALSCWLALAAPALAAPPAGPPYPDAVPGQRVYDYAGIFSPQSIAEAETIIAGIEQRTGAQVAVYTQVKPESDSIAKANADAAALMDQWGVGHRGINDGLVVLFDMQENLQHGQVSLYAGSGYRAYLSDAERQSIFDDHMKPLLAQGDMDGGLLAGLNQIAAATVAPPPAGPPYPDAKTGQRVYDYARIFSVDAAARADRIIAGIEQRTGAQIRVYTQVKPESDTQAEADADARALLLQWGVGRQGLDNGLVILFDMQADLRNGQASLYADSGFRAPFLTEAQFDSLIDSSMRPLMAAGYMDGALLTALDRIAAPPAGPPYPDAETGRTVYDYAGLFSPGIVTEAERIIAGIEQRTGAQVRVYTQVKPESDTLEAANADARALMDQWGVGRKGFDDGLVILFDMQANLWQGQASLTAGSGYQAAFLTDEERQAIFDEDMEPLLSAGYMDSGLLVVLREIDANATPEHAATLQRARQINALIALAGVLAFFLLSGWTLVGWLRTGRDPIYIDDNSVLMAGPPDDLTPAMATLLLADRTSDRTLSAGLIDLAARGSIAFEAEDPGDEDAEMSIRFLRSGHVGGAEGTLLGAIEARAPEDGYVPPTDLYELRDAFDSFKRKLEHRAVELRWLRSVPSTVVPPWALLGGFEIAVAAFIGLLWLTIEASGLLVLTLGLALAGVITVVVAYFMPARTKLGSMLYAMLAAYRRTLQKTMDQAESMGEIVKAKALPWVETPDQVMAWAVAFGLNDELEKVLKRSMTAPAAASGRASGVASDAIWAPSWWRAGSAASGASGSGASFAGSGGSRDTHGLYSATAIPDPGSIVAALRSITHAPSPYTGGGGGGGSYGGGSAGGGFGSSSSGGGSYGGGSYGGGSYGGGSSSGGGGAGGGF
jgi:uncharacterized membrane protein YgcG